MKINKHSKRFKTANLTKQLSASLIVQRLPVHRQLGQSLALLDKCEPVWQQWLTGQSTIKLSHNPTFLSPNSSGFSSSTLNASPAISLSHFQNGELIIHCDTAILATQLKQQQTSLQCFFNDNGLGEIERISVRIGKQSEANKNTAQKNIDDLSPSQTKPKPNDLALNSIKIAQKTATSDALSDSLNRLVKTIEGNKN
ncbi:MAG: hypothetical protein KTR16_11865 [Acidiferrobacterales bacterium]|nr:hypothetical protein [Acidiferrobacterales bacterium]